MSLQFLHKRLSAIAPISGVSSKGRIDFLPEATEKQRTDAQAFLDSYVEVPEPDIEGFGVALIPNASWRRVLDQSPTLAAMVVRRVERSLSNPDDLTVVQTTWNQLNSTVAPALTEEEISDLNDLASAYNIPVSLDSSGNMLLE